MNYPIRIRRSINHPDVVVSNPRQFREYLQRDLNLSRAFVLHCDTDEMIDIIRQRGGGVTSERPWIGGPDLYTGDAETHEKDSAPYAIFD